MCPARAGRSRWRVTSRPRRTLAEEVASRIGRATLDRSENFQQGPRPELDQTTHRSVPPRMPRPVARWVRWRRMDGAQLSDAGILEDWLDQLAGHFNRAARIAEAQ